MVLIGYWVTGWVKLKFITHTTCPNKPTTNSLSRQFLMNYTNV